jgi:hypothetical protein
MNKRMAVLLLLAAALLPLAVSAQSPQGWDISWYLPANPGGPGISAFAAEDPVTQMPDLGAAPSSTFLGFQSKTAFHRFSGWMSGGLLLAAGIVGGVHVLDMVNQAHGYRDSHNIEDFSAASCAAEVQYVYDLPSSQALRWTHVGLLAAGESFYLANGITGTSFMSALEPGWNPPRIHRYAFFAHLGLMVCEGILGLIMTDAMQSQNHELFSELAVVHAGIGIAIPVVILGAGAIMKDY